MNTHLFSSKQVDDDDDDDDDDDEAFKTRV